MSIFDVDDTIHKVEDFNTLDWSRLTPQTYKTGNVWSIGRGGYGLPDTTWTIQIFKEDQPNSWSVSSDIYPIPEGLSYVIDMIKRLAGESATRDIRHKLFELAKE